MHSKYHIFNIVALAVLLVASCFADSAAAQAPWNPSMWGTSDTSVKYNYGVYDWPVSPCPEVQIKQKHDHTSLKQYRAQGWDTVINCTNMQQGIELSCIPFIPTRDFNGQYTVDPIPYDPPDTTFAYGTQGTSMKMPVSTDDDFAERPTYIPFRFFFFGIEKRAFVLGANGLITFDTTAKGRYCPWAFNATLPWTNSKSNVPNGLGCTKNNMRDAIYGIYEDTHPIASYLHGDQGIYYGIQGEYPCRKIICSWNGIPAFPGSRNQNNRSTYQIVCYEGSNIIEVHVKRRAVNSAWQGGRGLLGIQNATGEPQVTGATGQSNMFVHGGAPAAYFPQGYNLLTSGVDSCVAFRFTPQDNTSTQRVAKWYRIFDNDSIVELSQLTNETPEAINDTNGYYRPLGFDLTNRPFLSLAHVNPRCVSRYMFQLFFLDAGDSAYYLSDTIVVGIDTAVNMTLRPTGGSSADHQLNLCAGQEGRMTLEFPELQDTARVAFTLTRMSDNTVLADSLLTLGQMYLDEQTKLKRIPIILQPEATAHGVQPGVIDSINVQCYVQFVSGCEQFVNLQVCAYPNYDTVVDTGICQGEHFLWDLNGQSYSASTTTPQVTLHTATAQCDSVVHLHLTVSDTSHTLFPVSACKPYTWINGVTYYESNTATAYRDTVHLRNHWGCDSTVQLAFTMTPMTPIIEASLDHFDFNNLNVELTDVSTGGNGRTWLFPNGDPQYGQVAYYTIPYNADSAVIHMIETSPYGCIDTATVVIPFRRDVIWAPNIFTPDLPDNGNDHFHSVSTHLLREQTLIYNRFGELIFQCEEIDCHWDGTDRSGNPCPQGTYVYIIRYTTEYAPYETQLLKGSVTLVR